LIEANEGRSPDTERHYPAAIGEWEAAGEGDRMSAVPELTNLVPRAASAPCTGDADQKCSVFRPDGGERHDPTRLAYTHQTNLCEIDIASGLQVFERGHHVAGEIVKRRRVPVSRRSAHTSVAVPQERHAASYQEPREGNHGFPILGTGAGIVSKS
jgi:hypothetical protein